MKRLVRSLFSFVVFSLVTACAVKDVSSRPPREEVEAHNGGGSPIMCVDGSLACGVLAVVAAASAAAIERSGPDVDPRTIFLECRSIANDSEVGFPCGPLAISVTEQRSGKTTELVDRGFGISIPGIRAGVPYRLQIRPRGCDAGVVIENVHGGELRKIRLSPSCRH